MNPVFTKKSIGNPCCRGLFVRHSTSVAGRRSNTRALGGFQFLLSPSSTGCDKNSAWKSPDRHWRSRICSMLTASSRRSARRCRIAPLLRRRCRPAGSGLGAPPLRPRQLRLWPHVGGGSTDVGHRAPSHAVPALASPLNEAVREALRVQQLAAGLELTYLLPGTFQLRNKLGAILISS